MKEVIYWGLLTCLLLVTCVGSFFFSLAKKRLNIFMISIALFFLFIGSGAVTVWKVTSKSLHTGRLLFMGRTGDEIYAANFGIPKSGCVKVLQFEDPKIPILDGALLLSFKTCPDELKRILAQKDYRYEIRHKVDDIGFGTTDWKTPQLLHDSIQAYTYTDSQGMIRTMLYASPDSTEAYFIDIYN